MKLSLHHINFVSEDVERLRRFYADVLGMGEQADDIPVREMQRGYNGDVAFLGDGAMQMHLAQKDLELGFKTGNIVNPVEKGHIAFRTDDIEAFKQRLEEQGVAYSDYAGVAAASWHQIFFRDPEGNVIEVHQVLDADQ
ncbi:VOC family protein [Oricola sp.]|uniref:VOC family protein n=1 Tax=Oricola sp. TaxID=1979950 RepID=UPI003BAC1A05